MKEKGARRRLSLGDLLQSVADLLSAVEETIGSVVERCHLRVSLKKNLGDHRSSLGQLQEMAGWQVREAHLHLDVAVLEAAMADLSFDCSSGLLDAEKKIKDTNQRESDNENYLCVNQRIVGSVPACLGSKKNPKHRPPSDSKKESELVEERFEGEGRTRIRGLA